MPTPKYYLRARDVIDWCRAHGITESTVREAMRLGALPRHHLNGPTSKAHYQREEVRAAFKLPPPAPNPATPA
jgi:hypothetical protein